MSEMIEKCASAAFEAMLERLPATQGGDFNWITETETLREDWRAIVRAVLSCLAATPTEEMLIAARDWSHAKYGKPIGNDAARGCFNAMISACSAESPTRMEMKR